MNIQYLKDNNLIIFEALAGSHSHGTNIPTSDIDVRGVYIMPKETLCGLRINQQQQVNDEKNDQTYYELGRFIELLQTANPTVLELLASPEDCIRYKSLVFDVLLEQKNIFLTKNCKNSFAGYARQQIQKAKGTDKKMNWEKERYERKTPIDFCYVIKDEKTIDLSEWLEKKCFKQEYCGLTKVNHAQDVYALFYDSELHKNVWLKERRKKSFFWKMINKIFPEKENDSLGFKGISFKDSNDIRLSSIPKNVFCECNIVYNKSAYSSHCKEYKEYQDYLKNRNTTRYVDTSEHNQKIDGKNLMHCFRLVEVSNEIAEGKGLNVRRPNAEFLLSIRKGQLSLQELIDSVEGMINQIDEKFNNSNLPDDVDINICNDILIKMRKEFYKE